MFIDLRWLLFTAANLLLWFVSVLLNETIGVFGLALFFYGLWPILPALRLRSWAGWASVALPALCVDALLPLPYGTSLTVWSIVWIVVRLNRQHIRPDSMPHMTICAQISNAIGFGVIALVSVYSTRAAGWGQAGYWVRLLADFILSQTALLLVAPWFFAFENWMLRRFGLDIELREDGEKE